MTTTRPDFLDNLLGIIPTPDGDTYHHERDGQRLATLQARVTEAMSDGDWWSLQNLARETNGSEASVSARIRDLRKRGHTVERKYVTRGLWLYRLTH